MTHFYSPANHKGRLNHIAARQDGRGYSYSTGISARMITSSDSSSLSSDDEENAVSWPLRSISKPGKHDVIFGRGGE